MKRFVLFLLAPLSCLALSAGGRIEKFEMETRSALNNRPIWVYLPEEYCEEDTIPYPVIYLLHGINGDEKAWCTKGNLVEIMDSLIANRLIRPCLVVMPNTNAGKYIWEKEDRPLIQSLFGYNKIRHSNFAHYFYEIFIFSNEHFCISSAPEDHAIAGLSNGGCQVADIVLLWPDKFKTIGLFSPVLGRDQIPDSCGLTTYVVYNGKADIFRPNAKRFCRRLQHHDIPVIYEESRGGHTWCNWRQYLIDYLCKVFPLSQ